VTKKWKNDWGTPTYHSWNNMRFRCYNDKATQYMYYGGRGIRVCNRWVNDFDAFVEDMGLRPDGMTLDRIDPDGDYTPENCKWSSKFEQSQNRRNARKIEHNGKAMTIAEWTRELGLGRSTLYQRLKSMPVAQAMTSDNLAADRKGRR